MPDAEAAVAADERERDIRAGLAGAELGLDHPAEWFLGRLFTTVALPPAVVAEHRDQLAVNNPFGHGERRHERLAAEEQGPDGAAERGVELLQERPLAFEADQEVGVGEVEALAQDGVLGPLGGVGATDVLGGVVVPHEPALAVHADGHPQGEEVVQSRVAGPAEGGAQQADHAGPGRLQPGVAVAEAAASAPALHRPGEAHQQHAHAAPPFGNAASVTVLMRLSTEPTSSFRCLSLAPSIWQTADFFNPPSPYMPTSRP